MASYKEKIFMKFEANTTPLELEELSSKSRCFLNPPPLPPLPWTPHWSKLIRSLPKTSRFVAPFTSLNWGLLNPITIPSPPPFIRGSCQISTKLYDDPSFIIAGESILKSLFTFIYKLNLTNKVTNFKISKAKAKMLFFKIQLLFVFWEVTFKKERERSWK